MFRMLKQKTLKRLTRLGFCMYATIYCMAFTVYAGEVPGQEEYVPEEAAFEEVTESTVENPVSEEGNVEAAETVCDEAADMIAEEPGQTETADKAETASRGEYPGPGDEASISGLMNYMHNLSVASDAPLFVTLTADLILDDGMWWGKNITDRYFNETAYRGYNNATISGGGHTIYGYNATGSIKNLEMFSLMENLTIENCRFEGFKDGVICVNAGRYSQYSEGNPYITHDLTLNNCTFFENSGTHGGALCIIGQTRLILEDCAFIGNTAPNTGIGSGCGGAIAFWSGGSSITAKRVRFENNTADYGAAVYDVGIAGMGTQSSAYVFEDCMFIGNIVSKEGSAILIEERNVTGPSSVIRDCVFLNNIGDKVIVAYTNSSNYVRGWFGNTVDNADQKPDVKGIDNISYRLLDVSRTLCDGRLSFNANIDKVMLSNGTVCTLGGNMMLSDLKIKCSAENLTLKSDSGNSTQEYHPIVGGTRNEDIIQTEGGPSANTYSITVNVAGSTVTLTREFTRGDIAAELDAYGNARVYPKEPYIYSRPSMGDVLSIWVYEKYYDQSDEYDVSDIGPDIVDQNVTVTVNDHGPFIKYVDSNGRLNLTADEYIDMGPLAIRITADGLSGIAEVNDVRIVPSDAVFASVSAPGSSCTYGDDNCIFAALGANEPVDEGTFSLYRTEGNGNKSLVETWDLLKLNSSEVSPFCQKIDISALDVGNYTWYAEYKCPGGKYENSSYISDTIEILPRSSGIVWDENDVFVFDGKMHSPTARALDTVMGDRITVNVTGSYKNVGSYNALATGFDGDKAKNYVMAGTNRHKSFRIIKAAGLNSTATGYAKLDGDKTLFTKNISSFMPENAGSVSYTALTAEKIKGSGEVANFTAENGVVNALIKGAANGDKYKLPVKADSANYNSSIINILVTVTDGETPAPTPGGENKTEQVVYKNETLPIPADLNVTMKVTYPENIVYGRTKVTVKEIAPGVYQFANRTIKVDSSLLNISTVVFKAYNTKKVNVAGARKQPYLTMKLKARKGVKLSKQEKKLIKQVNKALKKVKIYFDIVPEDLKNLTDVVVKLNKKHTKVTKVTAKLGGKKIKLTKKEYSVDEINDTEKYVQITGATNFKGTIRRPFAK